MEACEIEVILLGVGLTITVFALVATFCEIRKSVTIATSNAETDVVRDLNGWAVKYHNETESYLFSSDIVPGKINKRLVSFLRDDLAIDWAGNAKCKFDNNKTICIFKDGNSAEIKIDEEKEKATLKIRNDRTYNLKVKKENGRLNIYEESKKKKFLYLQMVLNSLEHLVKDVKRGIYPFDEYQRDFLHMNFYYFVELEICKGFDFTKEHITKGHNFLLHVFTIYEANSKAVVGEGELRTPAKLRKFLKDNKVSDSQKAEFKKHIAPICRSPFSRLCQIITQQVN